MLKLEETLKDKITVLVDEAYSNSEVVVTPLFPNVLVRLLPRTQISKGGILLPEKQNKILIEAVVLEVFAPFFKTYRVTKTKEDGRSLTTRTEELIVSSVAIGDHILFHHHLGAPVPEIDYGVGEYRLVSHEVCLGKLDYEKKNNVRDWLAGKLGEMYGEVYTKASVAAEQILSEADIIRKDLHSLTQSGV